MRIFWYLKDNKDLWYLAESEDDNNFEQITPDISLSECNQILQRLRELPSKFLKLA